MSPSDPPSSTGLRPAVVRVGASCLALSLALTAVLGWATGVSELTSVVGGWATLKPNTAVALGSLAAALLAVGPSRAALAGFAGAIAAVTAFEWAFNVDLGIDQLLAQDPASALAQQPPGRMAAATALGIALLAAAIPVAARAPGSSQALASTALGVAWVALLGYACEVAPLSSVWLYGSVSLPTATGLASLAVGVLALRPAEGWLRVVTADDLGATLLRRLGPPAVLLPSATAWAALRAERYFGWQPGFALAVGATVDAAVFAAILASTASTARRQERRLAALAQALIRVQEAERRSVARELHDEFGQTLTALGLLIERAARRPEAADEARVLLGSLTDGVRRLSLELRPAILDDLGLAPALRALVDRWPVPIDLCIVGERRTGVDVELAAYRIAQEALTNAVRHASAVRIGVRVVFGSELVLEVRDDGRGLPIEREVYGSVGLFGMVERARAVGGRVEVDSGPGGTTVRAILPAPPRHG